VISTQSTAPAISRESRRRRCSYLRLGRVPVS
jgi:hypothetical protein